MNGSRRSSALCFFSTVKEGMCVAASYLALFLATRYEQLDRLNCSCPNLGMVQRFIVISLRFIVGASFMFLSVGLKGFSGWKSPLNIFHLIAFEFGFFAQYLVEYILGIVAGIQCLC